MATQRQSLTYYLELDYPYTVVPDDGSFFIEFPDLPGCMTQVENASKIASAAEEIRTLWIEGEFEDGNEIPEPVTKAYSGKFLVRLPKSLHRDLAEQAEREGVSLNAYVNYLLAEGRALDAVSIPSHVAKTTSAGLIAPSGPNSGQPTHPRLTVVSRSRGVA
jgi:antitoxin HicB